jgi:hypothetical protein
MRLGLKLTAFGTMLLLAKTHLYLSNAYLPGAQTASERPISGSVYWDVNSTGYLTVSAEGKHAKSSACAAKPGFLASISHFDPEWSCMWL